MKAAQYRYVLNSFVCKTCGSRLLSMAKKRQIEVEADEEEYQRLMSLDFDSVVFGSVLAV